MNKKELNFLINISKKLSGDTTTKKEVEEISKYLKKDYNTISIELVDECKKVDIEEKTENKYKRHGKGYKKKHRKRVKKKKYKSKKWNRY